MLGCLAPVRVIAWLAYHISFICLPSFDPLARSHSYCPHHRLELRRGGGRKREIIIFINKRGRKEKCCCLSDLSISYSVGFLSSVKICMQPASCIPHVRRSRCNY